MIHLVKVIEVRVMDGHRLWLHFSDGRSGVRDFTDILAEGGPMIDPLQDDAFFRRVFISCGVPSWPNGLDLDAVNLYRELEALGQLSSPIAAE